MYGSELLICIFYGGICIRDQCNEMQNKYTLSIFTTPEVIFVLAVILYSLKSCHKRQSSSTSETHRNKCSVSRTTLLKGMVENSDGLVTFHFLCVFGNFNIARFSSIVWEFPSAGSSKAHSLEVSPRSSLEHLHQIHARVEVAEEIPVATARNFQSPPR